MSEASYQIVVTGELVDGSYLPEVKAKLAALFKIPAEKLDPLFSGKRVVIKKGLGAEAAEKYLAAVRAAGLVCDAELMGGATQPAPAGKRENDDGAVSVAPVGATLIDPPAVATPDIDVSTYSVASAGESLVEPPPETVVDIDISALSMGSVGEDLVQHQPPSAPSIDTGSLSVAPAGSQMADAEEVNPPAIDTEHLDLAPVGSDVGEMKRDEGGPPPDTSHLDLE